MNFIFICGIITLYYLKMLEVIMVDQLKDNYISIEEAAKYLGVKTSTIRTWIKNNGMPFHRVGGKLLKFKRSEIDEWVQSGKSGAIN